MPGPSVLDGRVGPGFVFVSLLSMVLIKIIPHKIRT